MRLPSRRSIISHRPRKYFLKFILNIIQNTKLRSPAFKDLDRLKDKRQDRI